MHNAQTTTHYNNPTKICNNPEEAARREGKTMTARPGSKKIARKSKISWHRYVRAILVIVIGAIITMAMHTMIQQDYRARLYSRFVQDSRLYLTTIQRSIDRNVEVLDSISRLFAASIKVDRHEFKAFVENALVRHTEIKALGFIPLVRAEDRQAYEEVAREEGYPAFRFKELDESGNLSVAGERDHYLPAYYVEPLKGNEVAMGLDHASNPTRLKALTRARDEGQMVITSRIILVQETGNQYGILMVYPLYLGGTIPGYIEARRENLHGFAVGVYRVGDLVDRALAGIHIEGLHFELLDNAAPEGEQLLSVCTSEEVGIHTASLVFDPNLLPKSNMVWKESLTIPSGSWSLQFVAGPRYIEAIGIRHEWVFTIAGILFTLMIAWYLVSVERSRAHAEGLVDDLEDAKTTLEIRNEDLEAFVYMAAHDLRTPLVSIHGFLDLLSRSLEEDLDEQQQWIVERISANMKHFDLLLGDLLAFSRIHEEVIELDRIEIVVIVKRVMDELKSDMAAQDVTVTVQDGLPEVLFSGTRLYQVFSNLISNSLKFSTTGTPTVIEVGAGSAPEGVKIPNGHKLFFVRDNGIGIDRDWQDKIFQLFYRAEKEKYPGSGAGLAIVKRIIEQEDGLIWVESTPGKGAVFFFTLPLAV